MALFDLLGRRWALRVIWELSQETLSFRALRERCDSMSTSVLNERLSELREAEIVELRPDGYRLTREGRAVLARPRHCSASPGTPVRHLVLSAQAMAGDRRLL